MLLGVCVLVAAPVGSATADTRIAGSGPIEAIDLGDELSCQVSYTDDSDYEFYPPATIPGDCGTFLAVNGTLYAPDFDFHDISATGQLDSYVAFTPVSQTGVQGTGTRSDPYRVTTVVKVGSTGLQISETTSYVNGANSYRIDTAVANTNPSGRLDLVLYHAGDCYASGSDIGFGFVRPEVGIAGCSQTAQNNPSGRTIQMAPLSAGSSYFEGFYGDVWAQIATQTPFPDTCRCGEHIDNGVGLSWALSVGPEGGGTTRSLSVAFTEETPPDPGADSDGDGLPDDWESGNGAGGDYENLAPLGADPNRKDVFVHLDHKRECDLPAGWERSAIKVFGQHGIALHVDSGPGSLNADLAPWGDRSRAGDITVGDDISLWDEFDRLKDQRFVDSNRRRAFHYAAVVSRFEGGEGGRARDIPEADFVLTGCRDSTWSETKWKRYVTTTFVHELGHNLGLRHGGDEDSNLKPNYYGIMNYSWAWMFGIRKAKSKEVLPEYSWHARPEIDERHLSERDPQILPVAWVCPNDTLLYEFGYGVGYIDWDCDGRYGENHGDDLSVNGGGKDGTKEVLTGFNDWRPGAMSFDGGGVLGDFDLPERPDPPGTTELTPGEFAAAQHSLRRSQRRGKRQLVVVTKKRRLRRGRVSTLKIRVKTRTGKKRVRGVRVAIRGARALSRRRSRGRGGRAVRRIRTGRRGSVAVRVLPQRRRVQVVVKRRGFRRGSLTIPVRKAKPRKRGGRR